jgi:hypothetical protein
MFGVNATEAFLVALWLIGIGCAVAGCAHGRHGLRGAALIVVAVVVPVLGSLLAVAVYVTHLRGTPQHADPPVLR